MLNTTDLRDLSSTPNSTVDVSIIIYFFFRRESITIIGIKETFPHSSLNFINFLFNGAIGKKVSLVQKRDFIERHCQGLFANRPNTLITIGTPLQD